MKNFICLFILNCIGIAVCAQEIVPGIVTKTKNAKGDEVYVFNNTRITGYDLEKINLKDRGKTFSTLVESLPVINTPIDMLNIFDHTEGYKSMPYHMAEKIFSYYESSPHKIELNGSLSNSGWMPRDSILSDDNAYFDYNGKEFGGLIEIHYKICLLGRMNMNDDYYSIFIYTITSFAQQIFLNSYTKDGILLSSIELVFSEGSYIIPENVKESYLRTVIDNEKRIHSVFIGGTNTCEKNTIALDDSGYFKTLKIQVYDCNSLPNIGLEEYSSQDIIDFKTGEILKAYISDPDGYTNVRKEPDTSSPVLYKIYDHEPFYIVTDILNGGWYKVVLYEKTNKDGKTEELYEEGYIHQSRVKIVPKD